MNLTPVNSFTPSTCEYFIGTVDQSNPTISNLLLTDPNFGKDCWRIIHSDINRNKPYNQIAPGTPIYLNTVTREIFWDYDSTPMPEKSAPIHVNEKAKNNNDGMETDSCGVRLARAVQSFTGRKYKDVNCYELLVNGLKQMGVQYHGNGGLKERLIQMAQEEGLSENSYLSGEGVIQASGKQLYAKTIAPNGSIQQQLQQIAGEMGSLLDVGQILSFSTPTRGHTGVVGNRDNRWVFINSGRLDHAVTKRSSLRNGVGEEDLSAEIGNWLRLAAKRNEPLQITVGCLDEEKLAGFSKIQTNRA